MPTPVRTDVKNLRGFRVDRGRELLRVKTILQDTGVLPKYLVNNVVSVGVDRSHGDVTFSLASAEGVCTK